MRKFLAGLCLLGVSALPSTAQAQYPAYYSPPVQRYTPAYPYGYPAAPAPGYYYPQPAPTYAYPYGYPVAPRNVPAVNMTPPAPAPQVNYSGDASAATSAGTPSAVMQAQVPAAPAAQPAPVSEVQATPAASAPLVNETPQVAPQQLPPESPPAKKAEPPVVAGPSAALFGSTKDGAAPVTSSAAKVSEAPVVLHGGNVDCHDHKHVGLTFFADYIFWSVHGVDVPYAQPFLGVDPATAVPRGQVFTVSPTFTSGMRFGAGAGIDDCSWVVGTVNYFRTGNNSTAEAPAGFVLRSLLAFPNTVNAAGDSLKADADYHITLVTADIDYKHAIINNDTLILSWLAGARYTHLDQHLFANYVITGLTTIESRVNFDGGGPRAGLDARYRICGGFFGYGTGVADLIAGKFTGQSTERNIFTGLVGNSLVNENRVLPILELELGFGWQSANGRLRISGGYYVGTWFNTLTVPSLVAGIQGTNFTTNGNNFRDTVMFDGLVGRVEFRY
jgi:hypothetical protein